MTKEKFDALKNGVRSLEFPSDCGMLLAWLPEFNEDLDIESGVELMCRMTDGRELIFDFLAERVIVDRIDEDGVFFMGSNIENLIIVKSISVDCIYYGLLYWLEFFECIPRGTGEAIRNHQSKR